MAFTPDLSHYYGRWVEKIHLNEDGTWAIELEGGIKIVNEDENYDMPDSSLIGNKLSLAVLEPSMTRLYFGTDESPKSIVMHLNPLKYGISDPNFNDGELVRPQDSTVERVEAELPASAPGEREVEGPDQEHLDAQSLRDPELPPDEEEGR